MKKSNSQIELAEFDTDTKKKILAFLNIASGFELKMLIKDDPKFTKGKKKKSDYSIGDTICNKITEHKKLSGGKISDLNFLDTIKGFGQDKLRDLAYSLRNWSLTDIPLIWAESNINKPYLALITHGTDGSDGLNKGIHLRWAFHYKFGFPPVGFELYKRKSNLKNKVCVVIDSIKEPTLKCPYKLETPGIEKTIINLWSKEDLLIKQFPVGDKPIKVMEIDSPLTISLGFKTPYVELHYHAPKGTRLILIAKSDSHVVWNRFIVSNNEGENIVSIRSHGINSLLIEGKNIKVIKFCYWICEDDGGWGNPINERCGFGLPYGKDKDKLVPAMVKYTGDPCDPDWGFAACRLWPEDICEFKGKNFEDLKEIISEMDGDGITVPVGWSLMQHENELESCEEEKSPEFNISPYNSLLIMSQESRIARILGLSWIDMVSDDEFYDYKIEAFWPENTLYKLEHQLTFEKYESSWRWFPLFNQGNIVFQGPSPVVVDCNSRFARVKKGLKFITDNEPINLRLIFNEPVKEVQIFIKQDGYKARIAAFSSWMSEPVATNEIISREGILDVHATNIKYVQIKGKGIIILRVHYDFESLPRGKHKFLVCGVKREKAMPLNTPSGLKAIPLRGGITALDENCDEIELRYRAGLRWNLEGDIDEGLFSGAPIGYYIERENPRGEKSLLNDGHPVNVIPDDPSTKEESVKFQGFEKQTGKDYIKDDDLVKDRQYFIDAVEEKGLYKYKVRSFDIFGRKSPYCNSVSVELKPGLPPPPLNVIAKFLDYTTYDDENNTFGDPALSELEKNWLRTHRKSAIAIRWKWMPSQQKQAPDVLNFNIYLINCWLNILKGNVTQVNDVSNGFKIYTNLNVPANKLRDEWLRQGNLIFKIKSNTGGSNSQIMVDALPSWLNLPDDLAKPKAGMPFNISVTKPAEQGGFAINYKDPVRWGNPIYSENIKPDDSTDYEVYIPVDQLNYPNFGDEKLSYAQIGVTSEIDEGEGSVSTPATIMAVSRVKPPIPEMPIYPDGETLKATAADFYGKSTFEFTWTKSSDLGIKYDIFRALDQTLFLIDKKNRENGHRNENYYNPVSTALSIQLNSEDDDNLISANIDYNSLTNNSRRVLANLPDNISAFSKLNDKPIKPGSSSTMAYSDASLDGKSGNLYFYRVRPVDEIGNQGEFGPATMPVECPKVTPVTAPMISKIVGGDRSITVRWTGNPDANIIGYLLYRTDDKTKSYDWRRMTLIKFDSADEYSVEVPIDYPTDNQFEFTDNLIEPRKPYWYGLVAVTSGKDGCKLRSKISGVRTAEAFDLHVPEPPVWQEAKWVLLDESSGDEEVWPTDGVIPSGKKAVIKLVWDSKDENGTFIITKKSRKDLSWQSLKDDQEYSSIEDNKYQLYDDDVSVEQTYGYQIKTKSVAGVMSITARKLEVGRP